MPHSHRKLTDNPQNGGDGAMDGKLIVMPEIVVLCGSTRFYEAFERANRELTLDGKIVLSVGCVASDGGRLDISPEQKLKLDELHKRKIDLANRVLVLNVGGYIGESTRSEIVYALSHGKPVQFLESVSPELLSRLCAQAGLPWVTQPPLSGSEGWSRDPPAPPERGKSAPQPPQPVSRTGKGSARRK